MLSRLWRIELFGGLRLRQEGREITRFRTRKTASLLAYLAYFPSRTAVREELAEMFWPETDPNAGRGNLRTALASLRRQLEPPGVPTGSVLLTDNSTIRLNPDSFTSDVADFDRLLQCAGRETDDPRPLIDAVALYHGEMLPGFYEEWIVPERARSAEVCYAALRRLIAMMERSGDLTEALGYAMRAVGLEPLRQEAHADLIRLYRATDQPAAAVRQYRILERVLRRELNMAPSPAIRALMGVLPEEQTDASARLSMGGASLRAAVPAGEAGQSSLAVPAGEAGQSSLAVPAGEAGQSSLAVPAGEAGQSSLAVPAGEAGQSSLAVPAGKAWQPSVAVPHSTVPPLPTTLTRFFGREEELAYLRSLFRRSRDCRSEEQDGRAPVITLTGPGGSGKTRLALEAVRRCTDMFDAVYFAPLAELTDAALLPDKILLALGLPRIADSDALTQVVAVLRDRPSLLVLDNFEQLVEDGVERIEALCGLPDLTCLITSRRRLGIEGEREFAVLPLPTPSQPETPADLAEFPSVQLFTDRAQRVRPDFQITAHNAVAIGKLCARLDGLPLALELAATWAATLTPAQMLAQMEDRFAFLVSRTRGRPPRHRTLHAAIESSYRLLSPDLQRLFVRLAVFRGGWTWEAARSVGADPEALSNLALLQEHSLVVATESGTAMRFGMLEAIREFAWAQLTPAEQADLAARHAGYFLHLAEEAEPHLIAGSQALWLERLEAEHDNLRAALAWSRSVAGDIQTLFALSCALARFWSLRGYIQEGRRRLDEALACSDATVPSQLRARTLLASASLAQFHGDLGAAHDHARQGLSLYESLSDDQGVARAYNRLGNIASLQGDHEAAAAYQEAVLQFWRRLGIKWEIASALNNLGNTANIRGDYAAARAYLEEALTLARESGDASVTAVMVGNLGLTALYRGDPAIAQRLFEESLALRQQIGNRQAGAGSKANLAMAAFELGDVLEATRLNREALVVQVELGDKLGMAYSLEACMLFAAANGDYRKAAQFGGAAEAIREQIHSPLNLSYFRFHRERTLNAIRAHLIVEAVNEAWRQGRAMALEQAVALAIEEP